MIMVNTETLGPWKLAKKIKPIRAKPMSSIFADQTVMHKFLLDTLEAREAVSPDMMFCIGEADDVWPQTPARLLNKYDVIGFDPDGWMICFPKQENSVESLEISAELFSVPFGDSIAIYARWGEDVGLGKCIQHGDLGDYICRQIDDHSDQWIVRRALFLNTYSLIN